MSIRELAAFGMGKLLTQIIQCISRHGTLCSLAVAIGFLTSTAGYLHADSMFAAPHLGIPVAAGDARSRAMGGISAAIPGENFTISNPARTVNFWRAGLNGVVGQDYRSLKDPAGNLNLRSTEFLLFRGIFPSYKKFVLSWGICQWRDLTWEYSDSLDLDFSPGEISRSLSSDGGLFVNRFTVARTLGANLAFGLGIDWMFGRAKRERLLDFSTENIVNNRENFENRYSFIRPTFGMLASVKGLNVGFSISMPKTADVEARSDFLSGYLSEQTYTLKYPVSWRLGFTKLITQKMLIGADIEHEGWEDSDLDLEQPATAADQWRYCIGFELLPATVENIPLYRQFPLRLGFSQVSYPYQISGSTVSERSFSFGTGRYFGNRNGKVDIAFEYLNRKTDLQNYPEERVFRVVFSIAAFERWVAPPRRR